MRIIIQDVKHLKLKRDLLWVGTTTLVTVVFWVGYAVYSALHKNTVDPEVGKLLKPLNPSLDQTTLASLDQRLEMPETYPIYVYVGDAGNQQIVELNLASLEPPQAIPTLASGSAVPSPTGQSEL